MGLVVGPREEDEFGGGSSDLAWLTLFRHGVRGEMFVEEIHELGLAIEFNNRPRQCMLQLTLHFISCWSKSCNLYF
jgi:hypothetical protein